MDKGFGGSAAGKADQIREVVNEGAGIFPSTAMR